MRTGNIFLDYQNVYNTDMQITCLSLRKKEPGIFNGI